MKTKICTDCKNKFRDEFRIEDGGWFCGYCCNHNEINYRAEEAEAEIEILKTEIKKLRRK